MYPVCFGDSGGGGAGADSLSTSHPEMVATSGLVGRVCCYTAARLGNQNSRSGVCRHWPRLRVASLAVPIAAGSLGA